MKIDKDFFDELSSGFIYELENIYICKNGEKKVISYFKKNELEEMAAKALRETPFDEKLVGDIQLFEIAVLARTAEMAIRKCVTDIRNKNERSELICGDFPESTAHNLVRLANDYYDLYISCIADLRKIYKSRWPLCMKGGIL